MHSNLTNPQYQQMQLMQQQQRLAQMMQQKQAGVGGQTSLPTSQMIPIQMQQQQHLQRRPPPQPGLIDPLEYSRQQQLMQLQQQQQQQQQQLLRQNIPQPMSLVPPPSQMPSAAAPGAIAMTAGSGGALPLTLQPQVPMPLTPQQQQQPVAQVSQLQQQQQPQPPPQQQPTQQQHMLPFATDTHAILATNTVQKKNIHQYIHRDNLYQGMLNLQHKRHVELSQEKKKEIEVASLERRARAQQGPTVVYGPGYRGYGNGTTGNITKIRYPRDKRRRVGKREPFRFSLDTLKEQAEKEEVLVPIRIELEHEHYKLRDTFTWNLNESSITPEQFAEIICEDLKLPANIFADQIAKSIKEQLDDFNLNASSMIKDDTTTDEWDHSRQSSSMGLEKGEGSNAPSEIATEDNTKQPQQPQQQELELRTVIKLDITVGNWELIDQFEWDIVCPRNSPEEFANKLVEELGLGGEFRTAIAHSIREQIHVYIKSLLLVGFEFNSSCPIDDELRHTFLPYLRHIIRRNNLIERFTPSMIELTDAAIDRMEKDRMREARRKRRGIPRARRGVLLPDREPQKTHRTGFATSLEQGLTDEQYLLNANESGTGHHKRSAALKARMNIAAEAANTGDDFIDNSSANTQGYISFSHGNRGSNAAVQLNRMYHHQQIR